MLGVWVFYESNAWDVSLPVTCVRPEEVTLKDVRTVIGQRGKCRYLFQTQRSDCGVAKKEVNWQKFCCTVVFVFVFVWFQTGADGARLVFSDKPI